MARFDPTVPNAARMYSFAAGGKDYFTADYEAAAEIIALSPEAHRAARDNRDFLRRAITWAVRAGAAQVIDIGCGLPDSRENTSDIARGADPAARMVYVDSDPVAVNHAIALLAEAPQVTAVSGDLREPRQILENPELRACLDLSQPVTVVLGSVLHFIASPQVYQAVSEIRNMIAAGSCLIISHATADAATAEGRALAAKVQAVYQDRTGLALHLRTRDEITRFFDGFDLAAGGVASVRHWPAAEDEDGRNGARRPRAVLYGGAAVKTR